MVDHKKLNENLTATVNTPHGNSRPIKIKDSIIQGGVLSVIQYALLMDEINKNIEEMDYGILIDDIKKIGCLQWVDDVLCITNKTLVC